MPPKITLPIKCSTLHKIKSDVDKVIRYELALILIVGDIYCLKVLREIYIQIIDVGIPTNLNPTQLELLLIVVSYFAMVISILIASEHIPTLECIKDDEEMNK